MSSKITWLGLTAALIFGLASCTDLKAYHAEMDKMADADGQTSLSETPTESDDCGDDTKKTCISFVEYDDFGHLYNRAQLDHTIASAEKIASRVGKDKKARGGIIVVYVHGWHHDAQKNDTDLKQFHKAIYRAGELDDKAFHDDRRIMGIYLGWRGESVSLWPFNYLTFWDRKNTAHAVGNGAVFELFRKLAGIRQNYPTSRLVVVGHSFGAAVTYSAVSHSVLSEIIEDPLNTGEPVHMENESKRWDMIVLVNPAFEAMQVRSHFEAARSREYPVGQLPHLIIVTSEADEATKVAFPAGRDVSTVFKRYGDSVSSAMNRTAIGHYIPYVTHQLTVNKGCKDGSANITAADKLEHVMNASTYCFADTRALKDPDTDEVVDPPYITRCDIKGMCSAVAGDHYILRGQLGKGTAGKNPTPERMPIMNIRTTSDVMKDHNDIWNPTMQSFLVQFLLLTVATPPESGDHSAGALQGPVQNTAAGPLRPFPVPMMKAPKSPAVPAH
jgi:pimeloyl-ACP methyl ester carboxylesterase